MVPPGESSKAVQLALRIYVDKDLSKEIGAFVQYDGSKKTIPLVFVKYVGTDTDAPGLRNYKFSRIEIVDKKVAGEYFFVQTSAGIRQGKYMKYTDTRTGKVVTFQYAGDESSCSINH